MLLALLQAHPHAIDSDFRASLGPDDSHAPDIVRALRQHVQARYGDIRSYLLRAGLEPHELEATRQRLLR